MGVWGGDRPLARSESWGELGPGGGLGAALVIQYGFRFVTVDLHGDGVGGKKIRPTFVRRFSSSVIPCRGWFLGFVVREGEGLMPS